MKYPRFVKVEVEAASSRFDNNDVKQKKRQDAASTSTIGYFREDEPITNLSGNLPHWRQDSVTYFVTFRTADSLPQEKLNRWKSERKAWLAEHPEPHDSNTKSEYYQKFPKRIQRWLDQDYGECLLRQSNLKKIVENALLHFDGKRYDPDVFTVVTNHVHVIVTPKSGHHLSSILHSWKSFTANQINHETNRKGTFWQKETFDHIIRNPNQLERIRQYISDHEK